MAVDPGFNARLIQRLMRLQEECEEEDAVEMCFLEFARDVIFEERKAEEKKRGGSSAGRGPNLDRDHAAGFERLYKDYLAPNPVFGPRLFRRRNRMTRRVFDRLVRGAVEGDRYFVQRPDAVGRCGLAPEQKVTAALRLLCYGLAGDAVDEYLRMGESTVMESLYRFVDVVIAHFGDVYLRQPTAEDIDRHAKINERRGFPGMFGSLDCTHWTWKNCTVGWRGMFQDRGGDASIIMEAVATQNLWIWHSYIGIPGSNNDINVIDRSPLIVDWLRGHAPDYNYEINGTQYSMCYLLCDGIYPRWSCFVKTISQPETEKHKWFAKKQEAARKDVERAFGVMQGRFAVLRHGARSWDHQKLIKIWKACVILHNMIIEDEEKNLTESEVGDVPVRDVVSSARNADIAFDELLVQMAEVRDHGRHEVLQADLIQHLRAQKQRHEDFFDF